MASDHCEGEGTVCPAVCAAGKLKLGGICKCRPTRVKLWTMAEFGTEAPRPGDTSLISIAVGACAVPQLELSLSSLPPQPTATTINSPHPNARFTTPMFMGSTLGGL